MVSKLSAASIILCFAATAAHAQEEAAAAPAAPAAEAEATTAGPDAGAEAEEAAEAQAEVSAEAKPAADPDPFPIRGSVSLTHRFNHAQFVETETDPIYGTGDADFGYQVLSLGLGLSYALVDKVNLSANLSASKALETSFLYSGGASRTTRTPTQLGDLSVGASWAFYKVPVADIGLNLSGNLRFPTSKPSQSVDLITGTSVNLSASRAFGGFSISLSGGYTYNFYQNPTQQIDADRAPENIIISGRDLGNPLSLQGFSTSLSLGYSPIDALSLSLSYGLNNSYSSVRFEDDEFTSDYAQVGDQSGIGSQFFSASASYSLPFETGTSLSVSYSNAGGLYTSDNKSYRFPLFDTESQLHHRTTYSVALRQSL